MYCTNTDILNRIDTAVLAQLTDDASGTTVDTDVVDAVIAEASEIIDGYIRGRYSVPVTGNAILKSLCLDLSCYGLYARRSRTITDDIARVRDRAIQMLRDVQRGVVVLEDTATPVSPKVSSYSRESYYDDLYDKMLG